MTSSNCTRKPNTNGVQAKQVLMQHVKLDDQRFQVRRQLDQAKVDEYAQLIIPGSQLSAFPRPLLWKPKGSAGYLICDGWHRISAAQTAGVTVFQADVLTGSEEEAMLAALAANMQHGLPLTSAEREEAILRAFKALTKEGVRPSDATVHERLRIPESSVRACRERLQKAGRLASAEKVAGKDGKVQAAQKKPAEPRIDKSLAPVGPPATQLGIRSSSPDTPVTAACKPKPSIAVSPPNTSASAAPRLVHHASEPDLQQAEVLQVLQAAERILDQIANVGWTGLQSPELVVNQIQAVIRAGQEVLKAKSGAAVAA